jgi:hypothetical protein
LGMYKGRKRVLLSTHKKRICLVMGYFPFGEGGGRVVCLAQSGCEGDVSEL